MKITEIETFSMGVSSEMPGLLFVRIHTDEGLSGLADTYFLPSACSEIIHRHIAPIILGCDPFDRERFWRRLYNGFASYGVGGAELRSLSAIDIALWDIVAKACAQPLYRLLGGASRDRVPVYNTCNGPLYASVLPGTRAGDGNPTLGGEHNDFARWKQDPAGLAEELLDEGYAGMKFWPFDEAGKRTQGLRISGSDLDEGLQPVRAIRERVGSAIEIMIDGHGLWTLGPAIEIANALASYGVAWVEDLTLADNLQVLKELTSSTRANVSVSEYVMTRWGFAPIMESRAADIIMLDPGWTGGVTEAKKVVDLADRHGFPVTFHDCDGPVNFAVGVHLAASAVNALYVESVRAFHLDVYPHWVAGLPAPVGGTVGLPTSPGIGVELTEEFLAREDLVGRSSPI